MRRKPWMLSPLCRIALSEVVLSTYLDSSTILNTYIFFRNPRTRSLLLYIDSLTKYFCLRIRMKCDFQKKKKKNCVKWRVSKLCDWPNVAIQ